MKRISVYAPAVRLRACLPAKGGSDISKNYAISSTAKSTAIQSRNYRYILSFRDTKCGASIILDRLPLSSYDFPELPSGAVEPTTLESAGTSLLQA